MKSWVSSAFSESASNTTQPKKIPKPSLSNKENPTPQIKKPVSPTNISLAVKHEPVSRSDLVVHKNKIDQLNNLLDDVLDKSKGSIILIEGPAGSGKYVKKEKF